MSSFKPPFRESPRLAGELMAMEAQAEVQVEEERMQYESNRNQREALSVFHDILSVWDLILQHQQQLADAALQSYGSRGPVPDRTETIETCWKKIQANFRILRNMRDEDPDSVNRALIPILGRLSEIEFYQDYVNEEDRPEDMEEISRFAGLIRRFREHQYQKGEQLVELDGIMMDKEGAVIPHPKGLLVRRGQHFYFSGVRLLYEGAWDDYCVHPKGVVIRKGDRFLLNGLEPALFTLKLERYSQDIFWATEHDVYVRRYTNSRSGRGNANSYSSTALFINGKINETRSSPLMLGYLPHQHGELSYSRGYYEDTATLLYLNEEIVSPPIPHREFKSLVGSSLQGVIYLAEEKYGVITKQILRLCPHKKGKIETLYIGSWDSLKIGPRGVLIQASDKILLNGGRVLFQGTFDDYQPHPQGVIVRVGKIWRIYPSSVDQEK